MSWKREFSRNKARKSLPSDQQPHPFRGPAGFACKECGIMFNVMNEFLEHTVIFHNPKDASSAHNYACETCGRLFPRLSDLHAHGFEHDVAAVVSVLEGSRSVRRVFGGFRLNEPSSSPPPPKRQLVEEPVLPSPVPSSRSVSPAQSSKCPRCQAPFMNAWDMLEHTVRDHGSHLTRLDRKLFSNNQVKHHRSIQKITKCVYCPLRFSESSACLLHIVKDHRSQDTFYSIPDWADRVTLTAEVIYSQDPSGKEVKFKINVTARVKRTKPKPE